jgi:hypothetical protein
MLQNSGNLEENCTVLGYYATSSGIFLPTFRDDLSVPSSGGSRFFYYYSSMKMGPIGFPETSVRITTTR